MDEQQLLETDTTSLMKEYNFNNPVNVFLIFDDEESDISDKDKNVLNSFDQPVNISVPIQPQSVEETRASNIPMEYKICIEEDMLDQVAQNLSSIIQAYVIYSRYTDIQFKEVREGLKHRYLNVKYHYFKQSFVTSKLLLLPEKRNTHYMNNILNKVLKLTNLGDKMYANLKSLYVDLLEWTQRTIESENAAQKRSTYCSHQPISKNLSGSQSNSGNNFSRTKRRPQNLTNMQNTTRNNLTSHQNARCSNTTNWPVNTCNSQMNYINQNKDFLINTPNGYRTRFDEPYVSYPVQPPPTYEESCQMIASQNISSNNIFGLVYEKPTETQDLSRCSISRDSGFISPVTFHRSSDQMNPTINQSLSPTTQNASTSNDRPNPNVPNNMNTIFGSCHICEKITQMVCLGCNKLFYCSQKCQHKDWHFHKTICNPISNR